MPAWTETVRQVHAAGGLMGAQLYHAGRQRSLKAYDTYPVAPSALKEPAVPYVPRALTVEEIHGSSPRSAKPPRERKSAALTAWRSTVRTAT